MRAANKELLALRLVGRRRRLHPLQDWSGGRRGGGRPLRLLSQGGGFLPWSHGPGRLGRGPRGVDAQKAIETAGKVPYKAPFKLLKLLEAL